MVIALRWKMLHIQELEGEYADLEAQNAELLAYLKQVDENAGFSIVCPQCKKRGFVTPKATC